MHLQLTDNSGQVAGAKIGAVAALEANSPIDAVLSEVPSSELSKELRAPQDFKPIKS